MNLPFRKKGFLKSVCYNNTSILKYTFNSFKTQFKLFINLEREFSVKKTQKVNAKKNENLFGRGMCMNFKTIETFTREPSKK